MFAIVKGSGLKFEFTPSIPVRQIVKICDTYCVALNSVIELIDRDGYILDTFIPSLADIRYEEIEEETFEDFPKFKVSFPAEMYPMEFKDLISDETGAVEVEEIEDTIFRVHITNAYTVGAYRYSEGITPRACYYAINPADNTDRYYTVRENY